MEPTWESSCACSFVPVLAAHLLADSIGVNLVMRRNCLCIYSEHPQDALRIGVVECADTFHGCDFRRIDPVFYILRILKEDLPLVELNAYRTCYELREEIDRRHRGLAGRCEPISLIYLLPDERRQRVE